MKLKEHLARLATEAKIKIGSKEATAFFYAGTVSDFLNNADIYNAECRGYINRSAEAAWKKLRHALKNYPTPGTYADGQLKTSNPSPSVDGYQKTLEDYFKKTVRLHNAMELRKEWRDNFVDLLDREVVESAMCDPYADRGVRRITIRGHERGSYWATDEAKELPSISFEVFREEDDDD